jgi:hypothetical protein
VDPDGRFPISREHRSDPSQAEKLRKDIAGQVRTYPSFYGSAVGFVNGLLLKAGLGISPASYKSVMDNVQKVAQKEMNQSEAHRRESGTFLQDGVMSLVDGNPGQAYVEFSGAAINFIAHQGMLAVEIAQKLKTAISPPEEKAKEKERTVERSREETR